MEELSKHGVTLPPNMQGLTEEQVDELKLRDEWGEKCQPSGGCIINKDTIGRRNGQGGYINTLIQVCRFNYGTSVLGCYFFLSGGPLNHQFNTQVSFALSTSWIKAYKIFLTHAVCSLTVTLLYVHNSCFLLIFSSKWKNGRDAEKDDKRSKRYDFKGILFAVWFYLDVI